MAPSPTKARSQRLSRRTDERCGGRNARGGQEPRRGALPAERRPIADISSTWDPVDWCGVRSRLYCTKSSVIAYDGLGVGREEATRFGGLPSCCAGDARSGPDCLSSVLTGSGGPVSYGGAVIAQGTPAAQKDAALSAIRSQMVDVPIRIVVEEMTIPRGDMRVGIDLAVELAVRNAAIGTFWVDLDREGDLLLYLTEPQGSRLLVRRIRSSREPKERRSKSWGSSPLRGLCASGGRPDRNATGASGTGSSSCAPVAAETGADAPRTIGGEALPKHFRLGAGYSASLGCGARLAERCAGLREL